MRWPGRRMLFVAAASFAAAVVLLALLHSAPARSRALAYAVGVLRDQYGATLQASDLRYNLLRLRFELPNVRIAETTHQDAPFLQAGTLVVDLKWSALIGELSFDEIELRDPIVTFQRSVGRPWNVPLERPPSGEGAIGAVYIDRLRISNLQLEVDDEIAQLSTDARALSLRLEEGGDRTVRGTLRIAEGLSVRIGQGQTHIAEAAGTVAFDGRALSINDLRLSAPEGTLSLNGTLRLFGAPQHVDAQIAGSIDLATMSPWLSLRPAAHGLVRFEGRLEGPLFAPSATLAVSSADVSWWSAARGRLEAAAIIATTGVTVELVRLELNGGTVSGSAKIPFSDAELATSVLEWHDVDIESILPPLTSARLPRLDGRASGAARISWQGRTQATIGLTAANTLRATADRRDAIGVGGRLTLDVREGAWHATHDHRIAAVHVRGEMDGRLSEMTFTDWPLRGSLRAVADNLGTVAGEFAAAGLLRRDTWIRALNGVGTVDATLEGTLGDPRLTGAVRASTRTIDAPRAVIDLEAIAHVQAGQASVRDLRLRAGPNSVHGWLEATFPGQVLDGALRAEVRDIATLPLPGLAERRVLGSGTVEGRLGGTVERPQMDADVRTHQLSVFEQPIDAIRAQLRLDGSKIFARSIELTQGQGHATVTGVYDLQSHAFEMRADARGAVLRATDGLPLSATLDSLAFSASGTLERPEGRGRIELSRFDVHGVSVAPLSMDLTLGDGTALAAIRAPGLSLTADGRVTIASPWTFQLDGRLDGTSLAKVQEAAHAFMAGEPRLDGMLTGRVTGSGTFEDLAAAVFHVDLISLEAQTAGVPIRLEGPVGVDYARNDLTLGQVRLLVGRALMTAEGNLPLGRQSGTVRTTVKGDLGDVVPLLQLLPNRPTVDLRGSVDLALDITGSLERLSAEGVLAVSGAEVRWRDLPPVRADLSATYTNGALELQSLRADWQGARVSLTGRVPTRLAESSLPASIVAGLPTGSPPGHLEGRIEELTPRTLDGFVGEERLALLGGRVDATIEVDIARPELSGFSGEIVLDHAELMLAQVPLSQTTPTRLRLDDGRVTVERSNWSGGASEFNLGGTVTLGKTASVDGRIVGAIDLRTVGAFVRDIDTAGRAGLDLGVSGPVSAPEFEGTIAVSEGTVRLSNPRFIVTEINGSLDVTPDGVALREVRGTANGGVVALFGGFEYTGFAPTGGSVTATAREVAFDYPAGFRSESDADLTLSFPGGQPTLGGRITVLRGRYRESLNLAGLFVEASALTAVAAGNSASDFASRVRLDVALTTANDVVVDNNYGRIELDANLRVLGAPANPVMAGRITLREGSRIFLGGRTYQVESGAIDFSNSSPIEPDIEIVATTRVADYVVTLVASGRPGTFMTKLTAEGDQSLSERETLALVLTGRVPRGTEGLIADVDSQQVLGLLSSEVTGLFDRLFGLRGVRFEQGTGSLDSRFGLLSGDTDPSARLTIEQTIGSRLRVIVSQNLREAGPPTWLTIYRPAGRLDARFISRDDESRSMEVGQEVAFGAAKPNQVQRQPRNPPIEFRVADVRFERSPGFTRDELLGHISQRPDTTFDFVKWQEDRDRLERVYRDRGFLEARVGARRIEAPQEPMPAVVLEYQIERGPRTTLLVGGVTLPRAVYQDLEDLWSGAVFDELLTDDLASRVRTYLAETGYLQPRVEAHLDRDLARATKTVRIQIDPGTRSEIREVRFEGSAAISPDRLQAFLQQRGLDRAIWLDRDRVERELETLYRRTGYLAAEVAIPPPTLEGRIARLAVRIAEGSPFTIGTVKLAGVERRDPSFVQRELSLEPGTPFRLDLLDEGVRRLEQGYRDNGYREIRIEAATVVDRSAGAVDVTVTVREGPQHVIQEVTIAGGEAADQQTIDRALQLSSGQPVNAAVLFEARRRLYQLGLFDRVDVQGAPVGDPANGVQPVRAAVTLQEAPRYVFRYALQGTSAFDESAEGRDLTASALAELRRRNLFGRAASAGGVLLYRPNRRVGRASLTVPRLFTESMESSAYVSRSQERFGAGFLGRFITNKTELTLEQLYRSGARGSLVFNYRYERNHTLAEADPDLFDLTVSVARLSGSFVHDRRDDPLNTRRGLFHSSTIEYASTALGSDLHFAKWLMQQFLYRPAGPIVFASAARLGAGYPLGGDLTLIPSERFFTGGSTSVRGYVTDSLGPQGGLGDPAGGQGFLLLNQEARFPIYGWVGGVGFIDAGNVFERAQDISFRGLKVGVGVGLRIITPFALIRLDVARPWSPGLGEPGYRWHFSIGQLF